MPRMAASRVVEEEIAELRYGSLFYRTVVTDTSSSSPSPPEAHAGSSLECAEALLEFILLLASGVPVSTARDLQANATTPLAQIWPGEMDAPEKPEVQVLSALHQCCMRWHHILEPHDCLWGAALHSMFLKTDLWQNQVERTRMRAAPSYRQQYQEAWNSPLLDSEFWTLQDLRQVMCLPTEQQEAVVESEEDIDTVCALPLPGSCPAAACFQDEQFIRSCLVKQMNNHAHSIQAAVERGECVLPRTSWGSFPLELLEQMQATDAEILPLQLGKLGELLKASWESRTPPIFRKKGKGRSPNPPPDTLNPLKEGASLDWEEGGVIEFLNIYDVSSARHKHLRMISVGVSRPDEFAKCSSQCHATAARAEESSLGAQEGNDEDEDEDDSSDESGPVVIKGAWFHGEDIVAIGQCGAATTWRDSWSWRRNSSSLDPDGLISVSGGAHQHMFYKWLLDPCQEEE